MSWSQGLIQAPLPPSPILRSGSSDVLVMAERLTPSRRARHRVDNRCLASGGWKGFREIMGFKARDRTPLGADVPGDHGWGRHPAPPLKGLPGEPDGAVQGSPESWRLIKRAFHGWGPHRGDRLLFHPLTTSPEPLRHPAASQLHQQQCGREAGGGRGAPRG